MAKYIPTEQTFPEGIITIDTMDRTSYQSIQQSFTGSFYQLQELYYRADSVQQLSMPMSFEKFDAEGNISKFTHVINPSPFQFLPAINVDFRGEDVVFAGQQSFDISILPLETIYMFFTVNEHKLADLLQHNRMMSLEQLFKEKENEDW